MNGSNNGWPLCVYDTETIAQSSTECPTNYTNYCGTYTQTGLRTYKKTGTPSMFIQLITGQFYYCNNWQNNTDCSFGSYYNYWFLGNKSKTDYDVIDQDGGYLNFSAPGSPVYTDGVWAKTADGGINNASLLINTDFKPNELSTWDSGSTQAGYWSVQTESTVYVTCTTPPYTSTIPATIATIPPGTNAPSSNTQIDLTLSGDFATLTTQLKTALIAAVKLLFVARSSGLTVDDIKEVILSAGSIKATVVFNSDVDNADIVTAVDSIEQTPPTVLSYTVTGVSQPVVVVDDNGATATQSQLLGLVTACVLTYIFV